MTQIYRLNDNVLIWPNEEDIVFFLPILPPNIKFNDDAYQRFVNNFDRVSINKIDQTNADISVYHQLGAQFIFTAKNAFVENLEFNNEVIIVPYCPQEGIPNMDVFGATLHIE